LKFHFEQYPHKFLKSLNDVINMNVDKRTALFVLSTLNECCSDHSFSSEFARIGGHYLIKKLQMLEDSEILDLSCQLISTIISNGLNFPIQAGMFKFFSMLKLKVCRLLEIYF